MKVNAFCLSGSQGKAPGFSPSATLTHDDGDRAWVITMKWENLPIVRPAGDNPAEFLYAALWALMTEFDDHLVTEVSVQPTHRSEG